MKVHKKVRMIAMAAMLAAAVLTVNAVPAMADEVIDHTVETSTVTEVNQITEAKPAAEAKPDTEAKPVTEVTKWNKHEPNNELVISREDAGGSVIAGKMTGNKPVVIWTNNQLSEDEQRSVWESLKGNPGVGNPKDVVYISGNDASQYGMTVNTENGTVSFDHKSNWSLLYSGEYRTSSSNTNIEPGDNGTEIIPQPGEVQEEDNTQQSGEVQEEDNTQQPGEVQEEDNTQQPGEVQEEDNTQQPGEVQEEDNTQQPGEVQEEDNTQQPEDSSDENNDSQPEDKKKDEEGIRNEEDQPQAGQEAGEKQDGNGEVTSSGGNGSGGGSVVSGGSNSGGSAISGGSSSGGPGVAHVLDDQPETGFLDAVQGRQLDDVPKTGMPAEFSILLVISAISLISLVITLIADRKISNRKK